MRKERLLISISLSIFLSWSFFSAAPARAQVTKNVLKRVVLIRTAKSRATGFTLDIEGRQYLITAKHVTDGLQDQDTIDIGNDEDWSTIRVKVYRCDDPVDIAVLIPEKQLTVNFPLEPTSDGMRVGQDVYFTGFPRGEIYMKGLAVNASRPFPFTKKAVSSAMETGGNPNSGAKIYLDGHNNPGFSGAPIVFRDIDQSNYVMKVAGVVSGYQPEFLPVLSPKKIKVGEDLSKVEAWRIITRPDGTRVRLEDTDQMVASNMGIVIGYDIISAVELIKKHPEGPKVTDDGPRL
jgi:hypothetical protein